MTNNSDLVMHMKSISGNENEFMCFLSEHVGTMSPELVECALNIIILTPDYVSRNIPVLKQLLSNINTESLTISSQTRASYLASLIGRYEK